MSSVNEQALLSVAVEAASAAADELRPRFGAQARSVHTKSTPTDLVSEADIAAERAIRRVLAERRPGDAILGEEGGATGEEEELRWIVDPLDGTVNFLFGIPVFAVSVAVEEALSSPDAASSEALAGVVLDPVREECFAATRSGAATLNGEIIVGSSRSELATAMVATGFGYDAAVRGRQAAVVTRLLPRVRDIRRAGAAAIDLAWCACGRFDAYYERGIHRWDVAAGALIARRAGLTVTELPASDEDDVGVVVAPEGLIQELVGLVG
jgi:myo-inositol-1(or 4)-monophosphatase